MNILTFDIEDWYHILDNPDTESEVSWRSFESRIDSGVERILSILDENGQKASFFILGWVAREYPEVVKKIDRAGHEIGTHSDLHQLAYNFDRKEFENDLKRSIDSLENTIGKKVKFYRAPGFSIVEDNLWAVEALCENGIEIDCSFFPASRAHGGLKNCPVNGPSLIKTKCGDIKEFPINTVKIFNRPIVFSGGGYFRLLPYHAVRMLMKNSSYVMTYYHPRDFDVQQPMIPGLSLGRKFKSYVGLKTAESKLRKLLGEFEFLTISEANRNVDWSKAKVWDLS